MRHETKVETVINPPVHYSMELIAVMKIYIAARIFHKNLLCPYHAAHKLLHHMFHYFDLMNRYEMFEPYFYGLNIGKR